MGLGHVAVVLPEDLGNKGAGFRTGDSHLRMLRGQVVVPPVQVAVVDSRTRAVAVLALVHAVMTADVVVKL